MLATAAVVACGGGGSDGTDDVFMRSDTVAGVLHVHHTGRAPVARLVRTLVVGETADLTEGSPAEFGRVRSVMADDAGRMYVADAHALEIRVFEEDGGFVGALGGKGAGPGEIAGLHGTAWLAPDTIVVVDYGNARLSLLGRDGRHLGQWPWMRATGSIRFFSTGAPGEVYAYGIRPLRNGGGQGAEPVWVRYGLAGAVDSVAVPQPTARLPGTSMICRGEGIGFFTNPYGEHFLSAPGSAAERVVAYSSDYRLAFLDPAGDTVRILTRDAEQVPVSDDDWAEAAQSYAEFQRQWRGADCDGDIRRPRYRPLLRDLSFDHDGRLLVEFSTAAGPALDVYDTSWRWVTTIPLPADRDPTVPVFLRGNRLYVVARDSLDVQRVETYRIEGH